MSTPHKEHAHRHLLNQARGLMKYSINAEPGNPMPSGSGHAASASAMAMISIAESLAVISAALEESNERERAYDKERLRPKYSKRSE
jgi:hypothetical protein